MFNWLANKVKNIIMQEVNERISKWFDSLAESTIRQTRTSLYVMADSLKIDPKKLAKLLNTNNYEVFGRKLEAEVNKLIQADIEKKMKEMFKRDKKAVKEAKKALKR